jgi:hypothetical protein
MISRIPSAIPQVEATLYRGDSNTWRIYLTQPLEASFVVTSGSATVTGDTSEIAQGWVLYTNDTDNRLIGTVATVGSGTFTLTSNATFSYSGTVRAGIDWETLNNSGDIDRMWLTLATWGANQAVFEADLTDGITLNGAIATIEFASDKTQFRAGSYAGDLRVEYNGIVSTLVIIRALTLQQDRGQI